MCAPPKALENWKVVMSLKAAYKEAIHFETPQSIVESMATF
jgi:hypothetical protein